VTLWEATKPTIKICLYTTNQTVIVVDTKGELEFGCDAEDCSHWMLGEKQFLKLWHGAKRLLIIAQSKEIAALVTRDPAFHYLPLGTNQNNMLITNK